MKVLARKARTSIEISGANIYGVRRHMKSAHEYQLRVQAAAPYLGSRSGHRVGDHLLSQKNIDGMFYLSHFCMSGDGRRAARIPLPEYLGKRTASKPSRGVFEALRFFKALNFF